MEAVSRWEKEHKITLPSCNAIKKKNYKIHLYKLISAEGTSHKKNVVS